MWRKRKAVGSNGRRRLRRRRRRLTGRSPGECDGLPQKALSSLHLPIKPPFRLESLRRARQRETEGDRERGRGMDFPSPTLKPARRSRKTRSSTWDEQYGRPRRPFIRATSGTVEPNRIVSYSTGSPGRDEPPASERSPRGRPTHCRRRAPSPPPPLASTCRQTGRISIISLDACGSRRRSGDGDPPRWGGDPAARRLAWISASNCSAFPLSGALSGRSGAAVASRRSPGSPAAPRFPGFPAPQRLFPDIGLCPGVLFACGLKARDGDGRNSAAFGSAAESSDVSTRAARK